MADQDYKQKFKSSAEVLKNLFSDSTGPMADQFFRWKLWLNWKEYVGETVSTYSEPVAFHQGTLWLWVRNSTWLTQMTFMSNTIKQSLNSKFEGHPVKDIRVTLDRRSVPQQNDEQFKSRVQSFFKK